MDADVVKGVDNAARVAYQEMHHYRKMPGNYRFNAEMAFINRELLRRLLEIRKGEWA